MSGIDDMVAWALSKVGSGYSEAPGARCGPSSYDCSGFVYQACVHGGVRPPGGVGSGCSTTYVQWADRTGSGNSLVTGSPAKGDLVYFDNGDGGRQPGHVGIALGDGTMVNALNTQYGVCTSPLSYGGSVMGVVRLPGSTGGTASTVQTVLSDTTKSVLSTLGLGQVTDVLGGVSGVISDVQGVDKIATALSDPTKIRRIGKGALAAVLGIAAVFILKEGIN